MTALHRQQQRIVTAIPRTSLFTVNANRYNPRSLTMSSKYSSIATPAKCYADFCLIPVGTASTSVAREIAEVQRLLAASGLKYTMHSAGTTVGESAPCPVSRSLHDITHHVQFG